MPKPYGSFQKNVKFELWSKIWCQKITFTEITEILLLQRKVSLQSDADKLDIDKLYNVSTDLNNLNCDVDNYI